VQALLTRSWTAESFTDAIIARKAIVNAMARFMEKFDLILTPTAPLPPFPIDRDGPGLIDGTAVADDAWSPALYPANLTGQPAASVPAGWTKDGLPVGLQIMARRLDDRLLINAAAAFEQALPWQHRRPPVSVWNPPDRQRSGLPSRSAISTSRSGVRPSEGSQRHPGD
jgi:aspartyl-tRNA(Asn)/glutamyl-tRNA(Gln) amidotransferase subunit A